jgi:hypothetical protein
MKKSSPLLSLLALSISLITFSCVEEATTASEEKKFIRIYDHTEFNAAFHAVDIKQTPDGGYIVLAQRSFESEAGQASNQGIYLLKADKTGRFVKDLTIDNQYINALPSLTEINGSYYFVCTSTDEFYTTQIGVVDPELIGVDFSTVQLLYPAAAATIGNATKDFVILSYDPEEKESVVSIVSKEGAIKQSEGYSIGVGNDLVDEKIIAHFSGTGEKFPFQVGEVTTGTYFFNGFYNFSLSLAFVNLAADADPLGVIVAEYDDVGFNNVVPLGGGFFATSQFNLDDNYVLPRTQLPTSGEANPIIFDGAYKLPEFANNIGVKILRTQLGGKNMLIYGSDTKSKQIGLMFYDEATAKLTGNRYLGFTNPFELGNMVKTLDGGLAVCGTTYIAGRFPRLSIIKLSKSEVEKEVK